MDRTNRPLLALAAVALVALAAVPCAAVAASGDRPVDTAPTIPDVASTTAAAQGSGSYPTPAGPTQGQLFGVAVVVALAAIGVAAWTGRPEVVKRVGGVPLSGRLLPGIGVDGDVDAAPPDAPDDGSLLTDEERILELLEENGGRLRQGDVVETTDWSKAKVSRLLSSMEDEDEIVRIQLGREKLIFLSGHEPSGVRSTLQEDS